MVTVVGFFCSRCKKEWLQTQIGSSASGTENLRSHGETCVEQLQRQEEGINFIGYYCASCNKRWLLKEWRDEAVRPHHESACHEIERDTFQGIEVTGYFCSMCKKEWSLKEVVANVSQKIQREYHTRCNGDIKRRVNADKIRYSCNRCDEEWQLLECNRNPVSTTGNVLMQDYQEGRGFLDEIKTYEGSVEVIGYFCSVCQRKWPLNTWNAGTGPDLENAIRDCNASTGCLGKAQKYEEHAQVITYSCRLCREELLYKEWNGNPVPNTEDALQDHHQRTGCHGNICEYEVNGNIVGYFCSACKKEWLLQIWNGNPAPDIHYKPVDHHDVSMFCCLQVSDTGNYVKWKNIGEAGGLQRGDHVAWLRCIGYWHHAIVESVGNNGTLNVIEWDCNRIHRNERTKWDRYGTLCCSPMYKVIYPNEITQQNPTALVLSRARARLNMEGYDLFSDNCEHFATFCKTGCHQSGQIFQLKVSLHGWCRRFFVSLIHIAVIVSFSESLESWLGKAKDCFGAILLVVTEIVYLIIVVLVIYLVDTTRTSFKKRQPPECSKICRCASIKAAVQSVFLLVFANLFSVFLKDLFIEEHWTELPDTLLEIFLGILGGGVGNMVGFWFSCCHCCCCKNNAHQQQQPDGNPRPHGNGRYERLEDNNEHDV